jgi:hypothetical protein
LTSRIISLIREYSSAAAKAIMALRDASGVGDLLHGRRSGKIKPRGHIANTNIRYQFHGAGCLFEVGGGTIDIDFGPEGRHDGFDAWRLCEFDKSVNPRRHLSLKLIEIGLGELVRSGTIFKPGWEPSPHLFYLTAAEGKETAN